MVVCVANGCVHERVFFIGTQSLILKGSRALVNNKLINKTSH